ncbi:AAA family ATPase [Dialister histaminiformans]|uniref:AAA family ATPase n=1 Tax=Allisonella histaminiformans TaxID=209880 RepID=UPI003899604B
MVHDNFGANGLYLLDEPEAALSPQRQLTLLWEIVRCVKQGAQFIIATHSPPFCWEFPMRISSVLTRDQFIAALTKKQSA